MELFPYLVLFTQAVVEEEKFKLSQGRTFTLPEGHHALSFSLRYPLVVQNLLPFELRVADHKGAEKRSIGPGDTVHFSGVSIEDEPTFEAQLTYAGVSWSSSCTVGPKTPEAFPILLKPLHDSSVDASNVNLKSLASSEIALSVTKELGETWQLSVFSPYWMVNKTGLTLQYSVSLKGWVVGGRGGLCVLYICMYLLFIFSAC